MSAVKYTEQQLREAISTSSTLVSAMKKLGINTLSGGMHSHISSRAKKYGISTSHFLGRQFWTGKIRSDKRRSASDILKVTDSPHREHANKLRRALIEIGRPYECATCEISSWQGKPLTLEVDHLNGNWHDNREDNLRFLCPNCHSLTETYGIKNKRS